MIRAIDVTHSHDAPVDVVTLDYDDRFRRRIALTCDNGFEFLLDLPQVIDLRDGDDLLLEDGRHIRVCAAPEKLMKATSTNQQHFVRIAWHIGNRHLPCEVHADYLLLRFDHVIADMLEKLGAQVEQITGPFNPEGGAYGMGRTHSHAH
jgi:urease accessory protein